MYYEGCGKTFKFYKMFQTVDLASDPETIFYSGYDQAQKAKSSSFGSTTLLTFYVFSEFSIFLFCKKQNIY